MGPGQGWKRAGMGLGRGWDGASGAESSGSRPSRHPLTPSLYRPITPCQCLTFPSPTLSTCHPITAGPAGRFAPKALPEPAPEAHSGQTHLTSEPGVSFLCAPAPAVLWCPAPHPSHHSLHSSLPGGFWGPLTTLWHHPPVQSSMGCTSRNPGAQLGFGSPLPGTTSLRTPPTPCSTSTPRACVEPLKHTLTH